MSIPIPTLDLLILTALIPNPEQLETKESSTAQIPCVTCGKGVIKLGKAVDCNICARWTHIKCTGYITESQYHDLCSQDSHSDNFSFICSESSIISLPFNTEESITGFSSEESGDVLSVTRPTLADPDHFDCFQKKGLHFIHMNARSILYKISELRYIAIRTRAAVITLSETWLDDSVTDSEISINDYCLVRRDRNRNIRKDIFSHRTDLDSNGLEILWCDILLPKS